MISIQARQFFRQLKQAQIQQKPDVQTDDTKLNINAFDLQTQRQTAHAIGQLIAKPKHLVTKDVNLHGLKTICVKPSKRHINDRKRQLIFIHGGGFVLMSPATYQHFIGHVALACDCEVIAPQYGLAPERPFPAARDQIYRFTLQALKQATKSNIATTLMGDSAGAALALDAVIRIKNQQGPLPACLVLTSPWLDLTLSGKSTTQNRNKDLVLRAQTLRLFVEYYLSATDITASDGRVSPLFAQLDKLPAIYCQSAELDLIRDDAIRLVQKVKANNGSIKLDMFDGLWHSFQFFVGQYPEAREAIDKIARFVNQHS